MTEQYTVKIEEFELKLSDAETKIKGNFVIFNEHFERKDALFAKQFNWPLWLQIDEWRRKVTLNLLSFRS